MTYKTARVWYYFAFAAMTLFTAANNFASADPRASELLERLANSSLSFRENKGQFPDHILYQATVPNATIWVTKTGMQYQFTRSAGEVVDPMFAGAPDCDDMKLKTPLFEQLVVATKLRNANPVPYSAAQGMLDGKSNYFLGNDPSKWVTDISDYSSVALYNVYPGTDLYYYGADGKIEYDFSLAPGADPSLIQIEYEGVKSLAIAENGDLLIETDWSTITQHEPIVYQEQNGVRIPLDAQYAIVEPNVVGFTLPSNYNPALALVIDPQISYGTYIGHSNSDVGWSVEVDNCGNAYLGGYTNSTSFPTSTGAYDSTYGGNLDVFVAKFNTRDSGAATRIYSTYLGVDTLEANQGYMDIAIDGSGNVYVTGLTYSTDFPITAGAYDSTFGGGEICLSPKYRHQVIVYRILLISVEKVMKPQHPLLSMTMDMLMPTAIYLNNSIRGRITFKTPVFHLLTAFSISITLRIRM